jgi:hypothetical protein
MITEGLERPLFTSGMVLSDTDLTALVEWIRARFALGRHRHGWGVVCGLDVRCRPDQPAWVRVRTGYAVSSAGADLVVPGVLDVDLTEWMRDDAPKEVPACGDAVVDLFLEAAEKKAGAELVDRCGCGGGCERAGILPTRVLEGAAVRVKAVPLAAADADPAADEAAQWQKDWVACHDIVRDYVSNKPESGGVPAILDWLGKHPVLDAPCDWLPQLRALLTGPADKELSSKLATAMLELVAVYRHRLLRRGCKDTGELVRLARVWLRRPARDEKKNLVHGPVVARVDAYPPYRRELSVSPARPVTGGTYDLTPFIWQRWEQVIGKWRAIAGTSDSVKEAPGTVEQLLPLLDATSAVSWKWSDPPPVPVLIDVPCWGPRVVGFRSRPVVQEREISARGLEPVPLPDPDPDPDPVPVPVPVPDPDPAPDPDPLMDIGGIGPAILKRLRAAGITTFEQLANASTEVLTPLVSPNRVDLIQSAARQRIEGKP